MPLIVRNLRLELDEPQDLLKGRLAKRLRVPVSDVRTYAITRRSLDARCKSDIHFVYTVEVALDASPKSERRLLSGFRPNQVSRIESEPVQTPIPGREDLPERPMIVGFGPAGMFAALRLAEQGYKPIVFERGRDVRRRHRDVMDRFFRRRDFDPTSNLLFGEGGAGTYSDGKLYTRVHDERVRTVLTTFYHHGADPDILVSARPHIGSDRLPTICRRIRAHIESLGGEVRFERRLDDIDVADGVLRGLRLSGERESAGPVVLAIGQSARDTIQMLSSRGVQLVAKPFQMGVRIEHPQAMVDHWRYGSRAGHTQLEPAEYQLVAKAAAGASGDLFSFCMCPGGMILPTMESAGLIVTNGASRARRSSPFATSGLVITVDPAEMGLDALAALDMLRRIERTAFESTGQTYRVPAQRASDFLRGRGSDGVLDTSYPLGGAWCELRAIVPDRVIRALERGLPMLDERFSGFAGSDAILTAPETRASGPVRIVRDRETREALGIDRLYPVGEGAGYAGGIVSAAIDGIKTADAIIERYARPRLT